MAVGHNRVESEAREVCGRELILSGVWCDVFFFEKVDVGDCGGSRGDMLILWILGLIWSDLGLISRKDFWDVTLNFTMVDEQEWNIVIG